jgi:RND family efflux transporter MFP subunit
MNRTFKLVIPIVAAGAMAACGGTSESPERSTASIRVTTARAAVTQMSERLEAGGTVAASESALISSRIMAPIVGVRVSAGDRVRRGDVLVTLDARDVTDYARQARSGMDAAEHGLQQARAERAAAEADQKLAQAWHARISSLHKRNSATAQERDEAEARLASAEARLAGSEAAINAAQANLAAAKAASGAATTTESFTVIRAPFDALVTERLIDPGNLASPGTPLVRLDSIGDRRVEATVDEARVDFINVGDRVEIIIDDNAASPRPPLVGTVSEIARAVDADRRAFRVKVTLPTGEHARSGTFARIRFNGPARQALTIPSTAVRRHGQVTSAFVVSEGIARLRLLQLGPSSGDVTEVLAGLEAGELVVTTPPPQLMDAQPVTADGDAPATGDRQ